MASKNIAKRPNGKWRARYRDESGKEHSRHFDRKIDASRWLDEVTTSLVTGQYVAPNAGKVTFKAYAEQWRLNQVQHRPTTRAHMQTTLNRRVYPKLGDKPIGSISPEDIRNWLAWLQVGDDTMTPILKPLSVSTIRTAHGIVSGIFRSAVRDKRIASNPCEGTRLPKPERKLVVPPTPEIVQSLLDHCPAEYLAMLMLGAGAGMRNGEVLGLTRDRIDFMRRTVTVDRQLVSVQGQKPFLASPKTPSSVRQVPLPQAVVEALSEHVRRYEIGEKELLFTYSGEPISRQLWGHRIWRPLVAKTKVGELRFHDLRHYYASLLIRYGESVKTVQARLGHASASETLDTYSHLWPDSDDRTRDAIDAAFRQTEPAATATR